MHGKLIISGTGCCLVDLLYADIDFRSEAILPYLSMSRGDGGLAPGKLVFEEELERYCGIPLPKILDRITGGRIHDKINIGGPSVVSLINLAQLTAGDKCEVRFYGCGGNDKPGRYLVSALKKTPVVLKNYRISEKRTPSTVVLSDPAWDNGNGERMFINSIGAAWDFRPDDLDDDFFSSDIVVFGGTALVPDIHDNLTSLLKKAKLQKAVTVINTVFDFRSEKEDSSARWPLGRSDSTYRFVDLLITDREEALRLSGTHELKEAVLYFIEKKVASFIITDGSRDITLYSDGSLFIASEVRALPVSEKISMMLKDHQGGDTTGCGDNFAGGVIASLSEQMLGKNGKPDLVEACCHGIVSGGYTCFYMGGTFFEDYPGEKKDRLQQFYESYRQQIEKI